MPRPRIHFTKEQRKLANSIKCKKSYEKYKDKRKADRQLEAQKKQKKVRLENIKKQEKLKKEKGVGQVVITTSDTGVIQYSSNTSSIVSKAQKTFVTFTNKVRAPRLFAEDLCHTYLNSLSIGAAERLSLIQEEQNFLSECVTSLEQDWNSLYQTVGACKELEDIRTMKVEVSLALSYIDELEYFAALGDNELKRAYKAKELWLQM